MVLSLDALFGLPRKKSAGVSHRNALQGQLYFCDQSVVDEFVKGSSNATNTDKVSDHAFPVFCSGSFCIYRNAITFWLVVC